jgi:hypothetical protein
MENAELQELQEAVGGIEGKDSKNQVLFNTAKELLLGSNLQSN